MGTISKRKTYPGAQIYDSNGDMVDFSSLVGVERTPVQTVYNANHTIPAGKKFVSILTDAAFTGTILGAVAAASTYYPYPTYGADTLGEIIVVRTAGTYSVVYY